MSASPQESSVSHLQSLWDFSNPSLSEERFREAASEAKRQDNHLLFLESLTQVARAQGLQRAFEVAHETLKQIEGLLSKEPSRAQVRYRLELGRVINSSGNPDGSRSHFERALKLAEELKEEYLAIDAAHMLGIVTSPEEQIRWNLEALRLAESAQDPLAKKWRGSLYNNLGWSYHDREDFAASLNMFEKARTYFEENGTPTQQRIARWTIARVYRSLKRFDEALALLNDLVADWESADEEDGFVFEELGECLLALDRPEDSRPHFQSAYRVLSKDPWLVENEQERLARLKRLGEAK